MQTPLKVHLALVTAALLHAMNYTAAKFVMPEYLSPYALIMVRVIVSLVLFWVYGRIWSTEKIEKKDFRRLGLCALFGASANILLFFGGLAKTTPANASLVMTITPILVLLIAVAMKKESLNWTKGLGIFLGLTGALILFGNRFADVQFDGLLGDFMVFTNALFYGIYLVLVKPLAQKYEPMTIFRWMFLLGLIGCAPFGLEDLVTASWEVMPLDILGWMAFVAIGATFLTYTLNAWALRHANPSLVGFYIYLQPLLATVISLAFGQDQFQWILPLVAVFIFSGVYLVSMKSQSP